VNQIPISVESRLRAEHPATGSVNIMVFETIVNFSIWFSLNDFAMTSQRGLFRAVNELNRTYETKYYIGEMGETETAAFFCGLSYRGPYEKRSFGQFVSTWQREMQALWGTEIMRYLA
jgi:hypothetical protein